MIILPAPVPRSTADLQTALLALVRGAVRTTDSAVAAEGGFPALASLAIDLTNATPLDHPSVQAVHADGNVAGEFTVESFTLVGRPFGGAARPMDIQASARSCRGQFLVLPDNQTALRIA